MPRQFTYGKDEKLKSRKVIDSLFSNGHSFTVFPLKVLYQIETNKEGILQAGMAVSTRQFKKAVDRNRIKRLMRESYRIQKNDLKETVALQKVNLSVFFIYLDKTITIYSALNETMNKCLDRLQQKLKDERPA